MSDSNTTHDPVHLTRALESNGLTITATTAAHYVLVTATDADGQTFHVKRDDGDLFAALVELAAAVEWDIH